MASANRAVGSSGYVSFLGTAISGDYRNFDVEIMIDTVEKSAGSDPAKSYAATLRDFTAKLTYAYTHVSGTSQNPNFVVGTVGALLWGPQGSVAGYPKGGGTAIVTGHSKPMAYNDLIVRTVTFQGSGGLIFDDEVINW